MRLLRYSKPYHPQFLGAMLCSIFCTLFDLAPAYLISVAVDVVVQQKTSLIACLGTQKPFTQLLMLSLLTSATWGHGHPLRLPKG